MLAQTVSIPVVKIDNRMAIDAVQQGSRIGIVATVATTLDPTERLIQRKANEAEKSITTRRYLVNSAFDALIAGNAEEHDRLLKAEIEKAMSENDVVVLAQGQHGATGAVARAASSGALESTLECRGFEGTTRTMTAPGIICSGSIVYDTLVYPFETSAWGTTRWVKSIEYHVGGNGANTARAMAVLGACVRLVGAVGNDAQAEFVLDELRRRVSELIS